MTEEEEFEFRARMERERGAAPAAPAAPAEPTGGAAFGVFPKQRAIPSRPETQQAMRKFAETTGEVLGLGVPEQPEMSPAAVGTATGLGAAAGAGGPAALQRTGALLGRVPYAPARGLGAAMQALGTGLQTIPTGKRVAGTAAAMGGTELTGQLGEQQGIPRAVTAPATLIGVPAAARGAARGLLGAPTKTREQYARAAEALGFKLSPAQVRADVPVPAKGATFTSDANQKLANELVSSSTGQVAKEISPDFVRRRLSDLGKEFDALYKGKQFNIDPQAVQAIQAIAANEMQLPSNASVSAVKNTAQKIVENYQAMASRTGARPSTFAIDGDALQRLRTDLLGAARAARREDSFAIYELVDVIDASIARNHPQIAAQLDILRPKYRNTIILEDLIRTNGIRGGDVSLERLGNLVMGRKGGVRSQRDLDQLAEMGRELQLRARWEREGAAATPGESILGQVLGTGADVASTLTGLRSTPARAVQRFYAE